MVDGTHAPPPLHVRLPPSRILPLPYLFTSAERDGPRLDATLPSAVAHRPHSGRSTYMDCPNFRVARDSVGFAKLVSGSRLGTAGPGWRRVRKLIRGSVEVASDAGSVGAPAVFRGRRSLLGSFVYLTVRSLFALVPLLARSRRSKELEILVLRHELAILRRTTGRPHLTPGDRPLFAALSARFQDLVGRWGCQASGERVLCSQNAERPSSRRSNTSPRRARRRPRAPSRTAAENPGF
jgi:hypothetical protein